MNTKPRPKHLDLTKIRLPLPGFVSILHRVSGFGMFLMIGVMLGILALSLESPQGYERAGELLTGWLGKFLLLGLIWAFSHHFIAGIRFLLLDLHVGAELAAARKSSALVLMLS
ncbi:MAG: succinate dehydrogenase, cytochrome b556 subunit, partial [Betaproteobacteria bacterium]|nr:succinate dehydrogenase, cytochrome b556 subunit [Betaproteobacteria bacterium]